MIAVLKIMAHGSRPTSFPTSSTGSSFRQPNVYSVASQQASVLAARIESKKAELENLRQLRDLSHALAERMQALEEKIGTLKDGTEGLSCFFVFISDLSKVQAN